eukprot:12881851-Prorocentrum_lima.AAC.1
MAEPDYFFDPDKEGELMDEAKEKDIPKTGRLNHSSRKGTNWRKISCSGYHMKPPCQDWRT